MKKFALFLTLAFSFSASAADLEGALALIRGVDKITGRTQTLEIPVGKTVQMGDLQITLERCLKKPPEETPENAAFLLVEEKNKDHDSDVVFNGWMFSSNPAISAMDHPIWDIWVLDCLPVKLDPLTDFVVMDIQPNVQSDASVSAEDLEEI